MATETSPEVAHDNGQLSVPSSTRAKPRAWKDILLPAVSPVSLNPVMAPTEAGAVCFVSVTKIRHTSPEAAPVGLEMDTEPAAVFCELTEVDRSAVMTYPLSTER